MNIGMQLIEPIESENGAILAGYTLPFIATGIARDLHIRVKPETDMTGSFRAYDCDNCCMVSILGYQWRYTFIDGE